MKKISCLFPLVIGLIMASVLSAQNFGERDIVPLKNWDAPMYWQPSVVESKDAAARQVLAGNAGEDRGASITPQAQTPANSLVFVGMTPCRVVDTRTGSGFTGAFGPPSLLGGVSRTFSIQSSATCSIPSIAQAYSFNITVVPPGFLDYITVWPTGQPQPNASTLNAYVGTVIANAAIMPGGTSGSVDVYASQSTDLIIDINGYYAQQSGITLAQGTAGAPSLSFAGDPGTGIYSTGAGTLNVATGGTTRFSVASNGDLSSTGSLNVSGNGTIGGVLGVGTTTPGAQLEVKGSPDPLVAINHTGAIGYPALWFLQDGIAKAYVWWDLTTSVLNIGTPTTNPIISLTNGGRVGIGTTTPASAKLHVEATTNEYGVIGRGGFGGVFGFSSNGSGVSGSSSNGYGVSGSSSNDVGVYGSSNSGTGVYGISDTGWAGYFIGNVHASGSVGIGTTVPSRTLTVNGRARIGLIPLEASGATVCFNGAGDLLQCGASSLRWKTNVTPFDDGLDIVRRLRPIRFDWKEDGRQDIGLGAEDVATLAPSLAFTNSEGEVEGVKYEKLNLLLINAIKEQQEQIEELSERLQALERALTSTTPRTDQDR